MSKEKKNWNNVKWTPFEESEPAGNRPPAFTPDHVFTNSIYEVCVKYGFAPGMGEYVHLSFKTHDRQARHDWREIQRIKNEICGPEMEGVELFPAESRLVDTANQYHLFVFKEFKFPFGFRERLVADGPTIMKAVQRPFRPDNRPTDLVPMDELDKRVKKAMGGFDD